MAAGSIATELTAVADQLRESGIAVGVLGIRCYRPFPAQLLREKLAGRRLALVVDKAMSYGYEGPICSDLRAAMHDAQDAPRVYGAVAGLGGRDVSPEDLVGATTRALADLEAGVTVRATDWIGLSEEALR